MKICAVIAEYNPIHFGHIYHIEESRRLTGCDTVLTLMSGNFVQRGEPAVTDKHSRAKTAVLAGSDIVIELPAVFALGNAELFAEGAVTMLNKLNVCYLSFGSECGDIGILQNVAEVLLNESPEYKSTLNALLKTGLSYPKCRELTVEKLHPGFGNILSSPNNVLAVEYIKAIKKTGSSIIPVTIKRAGAGYNDDSLTVGYPSSTAVRRLLNSGNSDVYNYAPAAIMSVINDSFIPMPRTYSALSALIMSFIKLTDKAFLDALYDSTRVIVSRVLSAADKFGDYNELLNRVKTKNITMARIKRFLMCGMLGITDTAVKDFLENPDYFNVLAIGSNRRDFLKNSNINLIARYSDYEKITAGKIKKAAVVDNRAAAIYSSITGKNSPHYASRIFIDNTKKH